MLADYDFYKNEYKGIVITDANSYAYFEERASDELALFSNRLANDETAQTQLKKCACAIADILYSSTDGKGKSKKVANESIAGYYSASYQVQTQSEIKASINAEIKTYLGRYLLGSKRVMW